MEKCKICELEGVIVEFKDGRGLSLHLRTKHNGMKLDDYRKKYGGEKEKTSLNEYKKKYEIEEVGGEQPEAEVESPTVIIKDYKILTNSNLSAMFMNENGVIQKFKKIVAIGTVEFGGNSAVSALIIGEDGILAPPLWVENFGRIIEGEVKLPDTKEKKKKKFGWLKKKKKPFKTEKKLGERESKVLSEELMTKFSQYVEEKEREKEK